jgi:hypothetical protein
MNFKTSSLSLAHWQIKHFIIDLISKNIINVLINESFDFIYISIIDSRFDDNEFKEILIDCDAADRSIENMN